MHDAPGLPYLREVIVFLVLAGVLIPLLARWRVNRILGFLAVGCLVGPYGLGSWVTEVPWLALFSFPRTAGVSALADLGIVFLMFTIGLEMSIERLVSLRRWVFGVGTAQVVLTSLVLGGIVASFGASLGVSIVLGAVLSFSSTAVVMQILAQRKWLGTPIGRSAFSVLLLQDLAVIPVVILVEALRPENAGGSLTVSILLALLKATLSVGAIYFVGRRAVRPLFHHLSAGGHADTFMALVLLAILGIAAVTSLAGLSMGLGAFLAGVLLSETEFRHEIEVTIEPFKGLLMGLFFMSVGMMVDPAALARQPFVLPLAVLGLIILKAAIAALVLRIGGLTTPRALEAGLLLGQGGEFAFIVVSTALANTLLDKPLGHFVMLVVALSLFATPLLARLGRTLRKTLTARWPERPSAELMGTLPAQTSGHVIIAGFGRAGQMVASVLDAQGIATVAVESDSKIVAEWFGKRTIFLGNVGRPEIFQHLGIDRASAVIITLDSAATALQAVRLLRRLAPRVPLAVRAKDVRHARTLRAAGANHVIPEVMESGLQLAGFALTTLGFSEEAARRLLSDRREECIALIEHKDDDESAGVAA